MSPSSVYAKTAPRRDEAIDPKPLDNIGTQTSDVRVKNTTLYDIREFLTYLHSQKEFGLYYYIFNEIEVISFSNNKLVISSMGSDKAQNTKIAAALFQWTDMPWNVIVEDVPTSLALKDKIRQEVLQSKEWIMLNSKFADAEVVDILLKCEEIT